MPERERILTQAFDLHLELTPVEILRPAFDPVEHPPRRADITGAELRLATPEGQLGGLPLYYQPASKPAAPAGTYSWRRKPAG